MPEVEAYKKLLSSQPENQMMIEAVAITHSLFTKPYYLVVNTVPLTATIPGVGIVTFDPASISPTNAANSNDLDQNVSFTISDVQNVLDSEIELIPLGNIESPIVKYLVYHSDFLDVPVQNIDYEIRSVPQKKGVFTINAGAPDLNSDETGEIYDFERFPMLRSIF